MREFDSGRTFEVSGRKQAKDATVSDIKASPERGKKRLIVREKSARGQSCAIDIPISESKHIERKEAYSFLVEEKTEDRYGNSGRKKNTGYKTYYCDEKPEKYGTERRSTYKSFEGTRSKDEGKSSSGRHQF